MAIPRHLQSNNSRGVRGRGRRVQRRPARKGGRDITRYISWDGRINQYMWSGPGNQPMGSVGVTCNDPNCDGAGGSDGWSADCPGGINSCPHCPCSAHFVIHT